MTSPRSHSVDAEWVAFAAGLKPMVRRTADPSDADAAESRLRSLGAPVVLRSAVMSVGGRDAVVLYAARRLDDAEALRALEAAITHGPGDAPTHREIGRRLGFPPCCTEAFCERVARGVDRLTDDGPGGFSEDYVAARAAWVARPGPWTNPLLMAARAQLVSFYPCRYDCPVATRYARAVYERLRAKAPEAAAATLEKLSRPVVVAHDGARVTVALSDDGDVTAAEPVTGDPRDAHLAREIAGSRVTDTGRVEGPASLSPRGEAPWCVDFRGAP